MYRVLLQRFSITIYSQVESNYLHTFVDMRTEIFGFTNDAIVDKIIEMCQKLMFHDNIPDLFAFSYLGRYFDSVTLFA